MSVGTAIVTYEFVAPWGFPNDWQVQIVTALAEAANKIMTQQFDTRMTLIATEVRERR